MTYKNVLAARVAAANEAAIMLNKLAPELIKQLTPLIGQKLLKTDGRRVKKYKYLGQAYSGMREVQFYFSNSSVHLTVYKWATYIRASTRPSGTAEENTVSFNYSAYLGIIADGVLTAVVPYSPRYTLYTEKEIKEKRLTAEKAENYARKAVSALAPFDKYDH